METQPLVVKAAEAVPYLLQAGALFPNNIINNRDFFGISYNLLDSPRSFCVEALSDMKNLIYTQKIEMYGAIPECYQSVAEQIPHKR